MRVSAVLSSGGTHEPHEHRFSEAPHTKYAIFFLKMSMTMGKQKFRFAPSHETSCEL